MVALYAPVAVTVIAVVEPVPVTDKEVPVKAEASTVANAVSTPEPVTVKVLEPVIVKDFNDVAVASVAAVVPSPALVTPNVNVLPSAPTELTVSVSI
jgi:DNA-binding protein